MLERYCIRCGRRMVVIREIRFWDAVTGKRREERWLQCPRFRRSWRNLWMGGVGHAARSLDNPLLSREWR